MPSLNVIAMILAHAPIQQHERANTKSRKQWFLHTIRTLAALIFVAVKGR